MGDKLDELLGRSTGNPRASSRKPFDMPKKGANRGDGASVDLSRLPDSPLTRLLGRPADPRPGTTGVYPPKWGPWGQAVADKWNADMGNAAAATNSNWRTPGPWDQAPPAKNPVAAANNPGGAAAAGKGNGAGLLGGYPMNDRVWAESEKGLPAQEAQVYGYYVPRLRGAVTGKKIGGGFFKPAGYIPQQQATEDVTRWYNPADPFTPFKTRFGATTGVPLDEVSTIAKAQYNAGAGKYYAGGAAGMAREQLNGALSGPKVFRELFDEESGTTHKSYGVPYSEGFYELPSYPYEGPKDEKKKK